MTRIELFLRTNNKANNEILKIKLPSSFVKELEKFKQEIGADDLLEVLIKSTKCMIESNRILKV